MGFYFFHMKVIIKKSFLTLRIYSNQNSQFVINLDKFREELVKAVRGEEFFDVEEEFVEAVKE